MYKIMTKLHTMKENVFAFHMVTNDNDEKVEYAVKTKDEAAEMALDLLGKVGYNDLRIIDDQSYYLDLVYGRKPIPEENFYKLTLVSPYFFHAELAYKEEEPVEEPVEPTEPIEEPTEPKEEETIEPQCEDVPEYGNSGTPPENNILVVDGIRLNETVSVDIKLDHEVQSYHFVINDVEYKTGLPKWITYDEFDKVSGRLTFNGITRDYYIEVIVDEDIFEVPEPIEPPKEDIPYEDEENNSSEEDKKEDNDANNESVVTI